MSPALALIDVERTGNLVEAGFWVIFGLALLLGARRAARRNRVLAHLACLVSILFGVSDLVESHTGAWWRPWWLFAWKALCVAGLVLCFLEYQRQKGRERGAQAVEEEQVSSSSM